MCSTACTITLARCWRAAWRTGCVLACGWRSDSDAQATCDRRTARTAEDRRAEASKPRSLDGTASLNPHHATRARTLQDPPLCWVAGRVLAGCSPARLLVRGPDEPGAGSFLYSCRSSAQSQPARALGSCALGDCLNPGVLVLVSRVFPLILRPKSTVPSMPSIRAPSVPPSLARAKLLYAGIVTRRSRIASAAGGRSVRMPPDQKEGWNMEPVVCQDIHPVLVARSPATAASPRA